MPGFLVTVNGKRLASVSIKGLNILTVQVHGDVIGEELASLDVFGGNYGQGDADKHLIWTSDYEISQEDEVEVQFLEEVATSHPGKTIEQLHPDIEKQEGSWRPPDELFKDLAAQPRTRDGFSFNLVPPTGKAIHANTHQNEYSFHFSAMWKWLKPNVASVWLTSNSLGRIEKREDGSRHAKFALQFGERVKLRIDAK